MISFKYYFTKKVLSLRTFKMKLFSSILFLVLVSQSLGLLINDGSANSVSKAVLPTSTINSQISTNKSIKMCQFLQEYLEIQEIEAPSEISECMMQKLRLESLESQPECFENPETEDSITDIKNFPTMIAIGFATNLCDALKFNNSIDAQLNRSLDILSHILLPEQLPCLQYRLNQLKPESPLVKNLQSKDNFLILIYCRVFFESFQSKVIDTFVKTDLNVFDQLGISGCMKINMTEHEMKRSVELGIVALNTPEDDVMDEIRAENYRFKQVFLPNMLECFLKSFYGN